MGSRRVICDFCDKSYSLQAALINHKLNTHKILEKRGKASEIIGQVYRTEDLIYSSDSECEYQITTIIKRIPKLSTCSLKSDREEELNEISHDITQVAGDYIKDDEKIFVENYTVPENGLIENAKYEKPNAYQCECIYCKKTYKNKRNLHRHLQIFHQSNDIPEDTSTDKTASKKSYYCKHCQKTFEKLAQYERHLSALRKDKPYFCKTCQTGFDFKSDLMRHKRNSDKCKNTPKTKAYLCTYCGKSFERNNSLTNHTRIHLNEKPYLCSVCNKRFIMKSNLQEHMNSHLGVKPYTCPMPACGKQFSFASGLRQHRLNMHEPPTIKCPFCDRMFSKKVHMESHSRSHTGEKPFKCEYCPLYFRLTSSLRIHRRTHTGERPFKCEICQKGFIKSYGLVVHQRNKKNCVPPNEKNVGAVK